MYFNNYNYIIFILKILDIPNVHDGEFQCYMESVQILQEALPESVELYKQSKLLSNTEAAIIYSLHSLIEGV
jgi:hypothetical protein